MNGGDMDSNAMPVGSPILAPTGPRFVALLALMSLVGVVGSLYLSMGMGLKACPLCFYQRSFAMAAFGALALGACAKGGEARSLAVVIALLATLAGLGVAGFHVYLEAGKTLECPAGALGIGSAPQQSAAFFVVMLLMLALSLKGAGAGGGTLLLAVLLGAAFAVGSVLSAPPIVKRDKPYDPVKEPLVICRPPFASTVTPDTPK
jgi:hypothetical protein